MEIIETKNLVASKLKKGKDIFFYVFRKEDAEFVLKVEEKEIEEIELMLKKIKEIEETLKLIKGEK